MLNFLNQAIGGKLAIIYVVMVFFGGGLVSSYVEERRAHHTFSGSRGHTVTAAVTNVQRETRTEGEGERQRTMGTSVHGDIDFRTVDDKPVHISQRWLEPEITAAIVMKPTVEIRYLVDDPSQIRPAARQPKFFMFVMGLVMLVTGLYLLYLRWFKS